MLAYQVSELINSLGLTHGFLVKKGLIPDVELKQLYEDEPFLVLDLEKGLELAFGETKILEEITFSLTDGAVTSSQALYPQKNLPEPFDRCASQVQVRAEFGPPFSSSEPFVVKGTLHRIGAADRYQVSPELHDGCWVEFHYTRELAVERIQFTLIERESNSAVLIKIE